MKEVLKVNTRKLTLQAAETPSGGTGKSFFYTSKVQMVLLAMSSRVQEATAQEAMTMQAPHEKNGGGKLPTTT